MTEKKWGAEAGPIVNDKDGFLFSLCYNKPMNIFGEGILNNVLMPVVHSAISVALGAFAGLLFLLLIIWSLVLKGLSLWKAARAGSKPWFIALLVVNTLGILELLYIFVFSKKNKTNND